MIFSQKIKDAEKEIENTKERLLNIMQPLYEKKVYQECNILGKDLLFYGDCCKNEAKIQTLKECQADIKCQDCRRTDCLNILCHAELEIIKQEVEKKCEDEISKKVKELRTYWIKWTDKDFANHFQKNIRNTPAYYTDMLDKIDEIFGDLK